MGLFAAIMAVSFHSSARIERQRMQSFSLRVLIPSLLPLASTSGEHVDYAAHFGGLIGGGFCSGMMLAVWPREEAQPAWRGFAATAALGLGLVTLMSFARVALTYPNFPFIYHCSIDAKNGQQLSDRAKQTFYRENREYFTRCLAAMNANKI